MRALSLTQPWASLVVIGAKRVETRSWYTQFNGRIAIHASLKWADDDKELCGEEPFRTALHAGGYEGPADLPRGAIIGTAFLYGCRFTEDVAPQLSETEREFGNYERGRYAWFLRDPFRLTEPIPMRGALGLWRVPELHASLSTVHVTSEQS